VKKPVERVRPGEENGDNFAAPYGLAHVIGPRPRNRCAVKPSLVGEHPDIAGAALHVLDIGPRDGTEPRPREFLANAWDGGSRELSF
jgi:hypothetical protein